MQIASYNEMIQIKKPSLLKKESELDVFNEYLFYLINIVISEIHRFKIFLFVISRQYIYMYEIQ